MKLTYNQRRVIARVLAALLLATSANNFLGWGWFRGFDANVMGFVGLVMVVFAINFRPTEDEHRQYLESREKDSD